MGTPAQVSGSALKSLSRGRLLSLSRRSRRHGAAGAVAQGAERWTRCRGGRRIAFRFHCDGTIKLAGDWQAMKHPELNWMNLALDSWLLAAESSAVVGLRMAKICAGGAAGQAEASRMVTEKIKAAMDLHTLALSGGLGTSLETASSRSVRHYRGLVRSNHRRLCR